ncbi:site-specific integrase, partial [Vibrio anguillarum]|nr:site-specific integrase [Vibrio anguillarum]
SRTDTESGEVAFSALLEPSSLKQFIKETNIIIGRNGLVVYPQSLYLVSKLRGEEKVKDTGSITKGLLAFTRFLDSTCVEQEDEDGNIIPPEYLSYKSLTKYEEEGAPWRFA